MTNKIKRFYKEVDVVSEGGVWRILLDNRPVKTTAKQQLIIPTEALANVIAQEWEAQEEHVLPEAMPMTQFMMTAIDTVGDLRAAMEPEVTRYFETELIAYPSDGSEAELMKMEETYWHPLRQWLKATYDIELKLASGIIHVEQDQDGVQKMIQMTSEMDAITFTAFQFLVSLTGSFVIPLAFISGQIDSKTAYHAAMLEQLFQLKQWGDDEEAQERLDRIMSEIVQTETFLKLASKI